MLAALAATASASTNSSSPTFARDIAPVVYQNCTPCHHLGGAGPFSLLTYQDVKKHAPQIADVTRRRYMPPWLPEPGYGVFQDERRLSDAQIRLIADWVRAGAPQGTASETPPRPSFPDGWQLGPPDLMLQAARPFTMPASGPDVFWNFVFSPNVKARRYVRAIEIRPGGVSGSRNIHHANVWIDRMGSVRRMNVNLDAGFPGMDFTIDRNPFDPDSHFLFWKPGTLPYSEPDGLAWRLDPGICWC